MGGGRGCEEELKVDAVNEVSPNKRAPLRAVMEQQVEEPPAGDSCQLHLCPAEVTRGHQSRDVRHVSRLRLSSIASRHSSSALPQCP